MTSFVQGVFSVDYPATPEIIRMVNAVCSGKSVDFTTEFMQAMPDILNTLNSMGWNNTDILPPVEKGGKREFIVVKNGRVHGGYWYMNDGAMAFEDIPELEIQSGCVRVHEDDYGDVTFFYTGWCERNFDGESVYFDLVDKSEINAWRELPAWEPIK